MCGDLKGVWFAGRRNWLSLISKVQIYFDHISRITFRHDFVWHPVVLYGYSTWWASYDLTPLMIGYNSLARHHETTSNISILWRNCGLVGVKYRTFRAFWWRSRDRRLCAIFLSICLSWMVFVWRGEQFRCSCRFLGVAIEGIVWVLEFDVNLRLKSFGGFGFVGFF